MDETIDLTELGGCKVNKYTIESHGSLYGIVSFAESFDGDGVVDVQITSHVLKHEDKPLRQQEKQVWENMFIFADTHNIKGKIMRIIKQHLYYLEE